MRQVLSYHNFGKRLKKDDILVMDARLPISMQAGLIFLRKL